MRVSRGRAKARRLRCGLAGPEELEWRRDPRAGHDANSDAFRVAGGVGDAQSRYIEAAVKGVIISSLYAPNGNPQPGPKFNYKLAWLNRLAAHAANLYAADVPVVLAGDYNVVPTDRDIYPTKSWARMRLCSQKAAPPSVVCSSRGGWMPSASFILMHHVYVLGLHA